MKCSVCETWFTINELDLEHNNGMLYMACDPDFFVQCPNCEKHLEVKDIPPVVQRRVRTHDLKRGICVVYDERY